MRYPETRQRARLLSLAWLPLLLGYALPAGPAVTPGVSAGASADLSADARSALHAISGHVGELSDPEALAVAFEAYYRYRAENSRLVRKPYLYFVDLGLDGRTPRGYVFDMGRLEVVDGPFTVAHGSGSSVSRDAVPTVFSNAPGSHASSLGLYLAQETYTFHGSAGGRGYQSVGLRLKGESGRFNNAARARGIVVHGAPYVTLTSAGRSEGCPAMEPERARRLLPLLANGGIVFVYSPRDPRWLSEGPWVVGRSGSL